MPFFISDPVADVAYLRPTLARSRLLRFIRLTCSDLIRAGTPPGLYCSVRFGVRDERLETSIVDIVPE